jgi:NADPH:quinone reductase-like Zn-dependent oxidoreductase
MKAARVNRLGPPEVITVEDIAIPSPGEQDVLVRVRASGVGPWDALVRTGKSGLPHTLPLTLGSEISGIVERVGGKTSGFAVGDEVFGATNPLFVDGYAEYAVAIGRMIAKKPVALSHLQAAALPVVAVTAWQMLFDHAQVREGQTVVVHGGAGNVGAYAVQFARLRKLVVIATIHGGDAQYVRNLGAEHVIDTKTQDFAKFARRADAVIDTVGGKTQDQLFTLAKPGSIIVSSVVRPNEQLASQYGVRADYLIVDVNNPQLTEIAGMFEKKQLTISLGSVLPLSEARAAHEMMAGGRPHLRGKIVLAVER